MTDRQRLNIINDASNVGAGVMIAVEKACCDAIEKEDLENEDAEQVIGWYLISFDKGARELMRSQIIRRLNERR